MRPALRDLIFGLVVAGIAAAYYQRAGRLPVSGLTDAVGAGGLPKILGGFLFGLGLLLAGRAAYALLAGPRTSPDPDEPPAEPFVEWRGILLLAIAASYILIAPAIGYLPAIFLLLAAAALTAGAPFNLRTFLTAGGIACVLALLFIVAIGTEQPEGPFGPMLRSLGI